MLGGYQLLNISSGTGTGSFLKLSYPPDIGIRSFFSKITSMWSWYWGPRLIFVWYEADTYLILRLVQPWYMKLVLPQVLTRHILVQGWYYYLRSLWGRYWYEVGIALGHSSVVGSLIPRPVSVYIPEVLAWYLLNTQVNPTFTSGPGGMESRNFFIVFQFPS